MRVEVAYGTRRQQTVIGLELREGATVAEALQAVGNKQPFEELPLDSMPTGVFGHPVGRDRVLKPGERLELYRPLAVDPKEARRRRAQSAS